MNVSILISNLNFPLILTAAAFSLVMALISLRLKAISISGAIGMVVIGVTIFGLGGMVFATPLVFFFGSASILSALKTPGKIKSMKAMDKSGPRDIWQVFANGGAGAILALIYFLTGNIIWFFLYLAAVCEATADTWATELGTLSPKSPVSIISFRKIEGGQSGGITLLGTLATVGGAFLTMLVAWLTSGLLDEPKVVGAKIWLASVNCGVVGSIFDSILGGSLQGQYHCQSCMQIVEKKKHCGQPTSLIRGFSFLNNDGVNFGGTLFAVLMAALIFLFKN